MYSHPSTAEQCLHNALKVVNAMRSIGIDYDIQAIDITDPNPISLLLLCVHLYFTLPQYVPRSSVEFVGALHADCVRQIKLKNPNASKSLMYHAMIVGQDARDFRLPKGNKITLSPKSSVQVTIEFKSRFLRPADATVVFVGLQQHSGAHGKTIVFKLTTSIDNIQPEVHECTCNTCTAIFRLPYYESKL